MEVIISKKTTGPNIPITIEIDEDLICSPQAGRVLGAVSEGNMHFWVIKIKSIKDLIDLLKEIDQEHELFFQFPLKDSSSIRLVFNKPMSM